MTLRLGSTSYDPTDPIGKTLFNMLVRFAEFETDLIRLRTRDGMQITKARAKGKLRGKPPKLSSKQEWHLVELHAKREHTAAELAELFGVSRSTAYRAVKRPRGAGS